MPYKYHTTCTCPAYPFPHKFDGGKCSGLSVIRAAWDENLCADCSERQRNSDGLQQWYECGAAEKDSDIQYMATLCPRLKEGMKLVKVKK
jgi:hypothetical protein